MDIKGQIYDHFIGCWLLHMGYGSSKNRKMFISRIKTMLGASSINKYAKVYNDFDELMLNQQEKLDLLI
jgi:ribosomal protein S24E